MGDELQKYYLTSTSREGGSKLERWYICTRRSPYKHMALLLFFARLFSDHVGALGAHWSVNKRREMAVQISLYRLLMVCWSVRIHVVC